MKLKTNKILTRKTRKKIRNQKNKDWVEKIIYDKLKFKN
jgi:hypothetical protein